MMVAIVMLRLRIATGALSFLLLGSVVWCQQAAVRAVSTNPPSSGPQNIVIGFVGGFISHDNAVHGGVKLAARLREDYPSGAYVKVFENHRGDAAHR